MKYDNDNSRRNRFNDSDWSDDFDERDRGRTISRRRSTGRYNDGGNRDSRDNDYDDDYYYDDDYNNDDYTEDDGGNRRGGKSMRRDSFFKRHPVLTNFLLVCFAGCMGLWLLLLFLDYWTFHGQERTVPDLKGQLYAVAEGNAALAGLTAVLTDSVYDSYTRPGTVVEQTPVAGAKVKKGGSVYLTVVAFTPKLVTVPDFYNVSARQARSMFEGLGIKEVRQVEVISEYSGLVLGAKFNGADLQPGARIPVSAVVTLEVGTGVEPFDYGDEVIDSVAIDEMIEEINIE